MKIMENFTKRIKLVSIMLIIFTILIASKGVNAETIVVNESELESTITSLQGEQIETDDGYFEVSNIEVVEAEGNAKEVEETKELNDLTTNSEEDIKAMFDENLEYEEDGYFGILTLEDVEITVSGTSYTERIDSLDVPFTNFTSNDLNAIEKEITSDGRTYNLINVDWEADETEVIDGQTVILSYKGTKHYQTVIRTTFPATYQATATYVGEVTKEDKEYILNIEYNFVEVQEPEVEVEETNTTAVVVTIVSGLGVIVILLLLLTKNVKIYNVIENKEKLVARKRVSPNKLSIDLSNLKIHDSNIYIIKLNNSLFNKIKNKQLTIKDTKGDTRDFTVVYNKFTINL